MIARRRVLAHWIGTGLLGVVGVGDALVSRSLARGSRPRGRARSGAGADADAGAGAGADADADAVKDRAPRVPDVTPAQAFDPAPVRGVLERLLGAGHSSQIELLAVAAKDDVDRYRIRASTLSDVSVVTVEGTSTSALLAGAGWYLKYVAGVTVSLPGDSLSALPAVLPAPRAQLTGAAAVKHRFALNDTENGYAGAYRTWADWERTLDVLALHGFTEVLVAAGQDEVYRRVFAEFGYRTDELDAWIPGASHQPWWLLGNLQAVDAPEDPSLRQAGVAVVRQTVARLRELGMTPVLPGYLGMVPEGFTARHPGARVLPQGRWDDYQRPDWLDPRDPRFARIAESFYRHQDELYGRSTAYKMDLLHEGGSSGGVPMGEAAVAVMTALQTARPGATWVMLGWQANPRRDVLDALHACAPTVCARGSVLIVDGCSDKFAGFDREADWGGTAYAFGTITNFGGRSLLGANAAAWTVRYPKALAAKGSALTGTAWMPEASGHDPAAFELFAELAWRPDMFDLADWFGRYAARRYGKVDAAATQAWQTFAQTAYSLPPGTYSQAQDSLFSAWPDLSAVSAAPDGLGMRYDGAAFQQAVLMLLQADPALRAVDAYRYDVVDFTRQALANHARVLLPKIKAAYVGHDVAGWRTLTGRWLDAMALLETLLATDERFLLGTWLRSGGYDARSLITIWGGRAQAALLRNYAARELAGLVDDVYIPRWRKHFAALEPVVTGAAEEWAKTDWFALDDAWARGGKQYPTAPTGDPFAVAGSVMSFIAST